MTAIGIVCIFVGFFVSLIGGSFVVLFKSMKPLTDGDIEVSSEHGFFCGVSSNADAYDFNDLQERRKQKRKQKFYTRLSWACLYAGVILVYAGVAILL